MRLIKKDKIVLDREDVEYIAFHFGTYYEDVDGRYITSGGLSDVSFLFKVLGWENRHYFDLPNPPGEKK